MNNEVKKDSRVLLICKFDEDEGVYTFDSPKGCSANEVIFCIAGLIKCFDRDDVMDKDVAIDLLKKYLDDPQYEEINNSEVN